MSKRKDLMGQRFGHLTVIDYAGTYNGRAKWHCRCDCGKEKDVFSTNLIQGASQSCGCRDGKYKEKHEKILEESRLRYYCCEVG